MEPYSQLQTSFYVTLGTRRNFNKLQGGFYGDIRYFMRIFSKNHTSYQGIIYSHDIKINYFLKKGNLFPEKRTFFVTQNIFNWTYFFYENA